MRKVSVSAWLVIAISAAGVLCENARASAGTLWVNDDASSYVPPGMNCQQAGYATIKAALGAAVSSDTVKVCPGAYAENLVIVTQDLTLVSTGGAIDTIIAPTVHQSVIQIAATGVTVKGFTIVPAGVQDGDLGVFVALSGNTGANLMRNVVRGGRIGINLGCGSNATKISYNDVSGQTEAGINIDTCEAPPFPGSNNNSVHHNTACSVTATASIALGGTVSGNKVHHNTATTISSFGTKNKIHHNTTQVAIVDNSGGSNKLKHNIVDSSVCP